jgi:hypothetical protein
MLFFPVFGHQTPTPESGSESKFGSELALTKNAGTGSVADPGCLSRIPDPDFYPSRIPEPGSRIPDPGSKNSKKREG